MDEIQYSPMPADRLRRFIYSFTTTILPIASFIIVFDGVYGILKPEWQSGELGDYVSIMLQGEVSILFYPFLIYAMTSYTLLLYSYRRYAQYFLVRFGVYTGLILSVQYTLLLTIPFFDSGNGFVLPLAVLISFIFTVLLSKSVEEFGLRRIRSLILMLILVILILLLFLFEDARIIGMFILALLLFSSPFWNLILYAQASYSLLRRIEFTQSNNFRQGLGALGWLFAYIIAWRFALLKTLEIYAALPTYPPDCYIATAAAKGHPRFVQSEPIQMRDRIARINPQLRYFKCAELALRTLFPSTHHVCRRVYDRIGAKFAGCVRNAIVADMVYVSLKPVEWGIKYVLKILIPDLDAVTYRVYASE